jgi:hypothetical protein
MYIQFFEPHLSSCFISLSPRVSASAQPILGRGRGSRRLLPVFVQHQRRHRPVQWLLHVHKDVSQHARAIVFTRRRTSRSASRPSPRSSPQATAPAHGHSREPTDARRRKYEASPPDLSSVCAVEEATVALATLRLYW